MKPFERLLLGVPLAALLAAPLAWGNPAKPPAPQPTDPAAAGAPSPPEGGAAPAGPAAPDAATDPGNAPAVRASPAPPPDPVDIRSASDREAWVGTIRAAQEAVDEARVRQNEAESGYAKARHKRKARGEAKRTLLNEREDSRNALAEAEAHLAETLRAARRAGVPPGWIREATRTADPANRN